MNKKCKRILSFILSLTMALTCMLQVTPLQVNAAVRANFALNKPVTASHDDGHVPENAVDGDLGTRWGADPYGTNQWIRVDLEAETTFDEFLVASENSAAQKMKKFKIEGSHDDSSYEMIYDSETKDAGFDLSLTINLDAAVTYRYVRITVESLISGAYPSVSLREFQVIGDEPTNITDVNEAVAKISIPSKIFKAFEIPSEDSELGVTFTWEALNDKIEISNGQVIPTAKGSSGLRLTASKDGYEKSWTFDFIVYDNEAQDYDIYPVVQQMAYGTGVLGLSDNINIVMDGNTPDYVKNYAQKVLSEYQYTTAVSADKSDSDINLLVGLAGDMGLADTYFNGVSYDKAISTDIDEGYVLSVSAENNTIAILGKDASGMYNGLSTLSQMLESSRSQLKDVLIEDAPDTLFRGIVEGFYGEYSFSERKLPVYFK